MGLVCELVHLESRHFSGAPWERVTVGRDGMRGVGKARPCSIWQAGLDAELNNGQFGGILLIWAFSKAPLTTMGRRHVMGGEGKSGSPTTVLCRRHHL